MTSRLVLREVNLDDASFLKKLVEDPDWIRFIGSRVFLNDAQVHQFIQSAFLDSYQKHGFGLFLVEQALVSTPVGICGLVKRPWLTCPDLGFALLPSFRGQGYALEASEAVLKRARETLTPPTIQAITDPENLPSKTLLRKLGFQNVSWVNPPGEKKPLELWDISL